MVIRFAQPRSIEEACEILGYRDPRHLKDYLRTYGERGRVLIRQLDPTYRPIELIRAQAVSSLARNGRRTPEQNARRRAQYAERMAQVRGEATA